MSTGISWADETWNPITGCSVVSPGCTHCYAMRQAGTRLRNMPQYEGLTLIDAKRPVWNGKVRFNEGALDLPSRWRKPRRIFVNSMGDVFHEDVPDEWIDQVFMVMALNQEHQFQLLTKRPEHMQLYINRGPAERVQDIYTVAHGASECPWPLPNVWLGVSVEDQIRANERIPILLGTPAAVRWVSAEPLLAPVALIDLQDPDGDGVLDALTGKGHTPGVGLWEAAKLDWVVCGGESGHGSRPMNLHWARSLRDQCKLNGTAFHFKQWGDWLPGEDDRSMCGHPHYQIPTVRWQDGETDQRFDLPERSHIPFVAWKDGMAYYVRTFEEADAYRKQHGRPSIGAIRIGKKRAGRLLDGELHDAYPA